MVGYRNDQTLSVLNLPIGTLPPFNSLLDRLKRDELRLNRIGIERSRWRGIEFIAGVGVPTTFLPSAGGASNE
jgi:hypothetical protein